ncbi:MAG: hypothetical protein ACRDLB_15380 [Actinomycetota bacterium]
MTALVKMRVPTKEIVIPTAVAAKRLHSVWSQMDKGNLPDTRSPYTTGMTVPTIDKPQGDQRVDIPAKIARTLIATGVHPSGL